MDPPAAVICNRACPLISLGSKTRLFLGFLSGPVWPTKCRLSTVGGFLAPKPCALLPRSKPARRCAASNLHPSRDEEEAQRCSRAKPHVEENGNYRRKFFKKAISKVELPHYLSSCRPQTKPPWRKHKARNPPGSLIPCTQAAACRQSHLGGFVDIFPVFGPSISLFRDTSNHRTGTPVTSRRCES